MTKSGFDRAILVIRSMAMPSLEILGGLAVPRLYGPAINGLELSSSPQKKAQSDDSPIPKSLMSTQDSTPSRCDESINRESSPNLAPRASTAKPEKAPYTTPSALSVVAAPSRGGITHIKIPAIDV